MSFAHGWRGWWVDLSRNNNNCVTQRRETREGIGKLTETVQGRDLVKNTFGSSYTAALLTVSTVCWELLLFGRAAGC
jgi:phage baseplate assembly protein W